MWETNELGSEDLLWAATAFNGGIGGQQRATCGAVSAATVYLGLRARCSLGEAERANQARQNARRDANELVKSFAEKFADIICLNLLGIDFSQPGAYRQFQESGIWKEKCNNYVQFVVEKLYELDARRGDATT